MKLRAARWLALAALLWPTAVHPQSSPGFVSGQIPTAAQWNSYFALKVDVNNGRLTSPTLQGVPLAPTPIGTTNTEQIATTRFVQMNFAALNSPVFIGVPTAPTAPADTDTLQIASTAFVIGQASDAVPLVDGTAAAGASLRYARGDHVHPTDTTRAPLASPALTGVPTAPTAAPGTNTAQIATMAAVQAAAPALAANTVLGNSTTSTATGAGHPVGNVLSGGIFYNAAGDLVGTAPTNYYLVGVADSRGISNTTCAAAGQPYYSALRTPTSSASFSIGCTLTGTGASIYASFITPPGDPGQAAAAAGNALHYIYASVSDPTAVATITVDIRKRALDGTETNLFSDTSPPFSNTGVGGIRIPALKLAATSMAVDDVLVFRIRGIRVSGPASFTLTITSDGTSNRSTASTTMTGSGQIGPDYVINMIDRGAKGDGKSCPDGVMTTASAVITSQCATWSPADVGKTAEVSSAKGIGSPPLLTTIASWQSAHQVTLADPATADTGVQYLGGVGVSDGGLVGSYIPGVDTFAIGTGGSGTTTGGTFTVQAVGSVISTTVRADTTTQPAITINSPGSGGRDGSYSFTGTTGTGSKFRFIGTVLGGQLNSASLRNGGIYTTNPTLTGEAVTSDAGVVGATVDIHGMDIFSAGVSAAGSYSVIPSDPAANQVTTGAGSSSGATGALVSPQWQSTGRVVWFTNDNQAFIDAINRAVAIDGGAGRTVIKVPARFYGITGAGWPIMSQPIRFIGDGSDQTVIYAAEGYTGASILSWGNLFGLPTTSPALGPNEMFSQQLRGAAAVGLTLAGNNTATNVPDAVRIYDRVNGLYLDDLICENIGSALRTGVTNLTQLAFLRESYIGRYRSTGCGTSSRAAFFLDSVGTSAGNNFLIFDDLDVVFPPGDGFALTNHTIGKPTSVKTIQVRRFRGERGPVGGGLSGDLFKVGSTTDSNDIGFVTVDWMNLVGPQSGSSGIATYGMTEETRPHDLNFNNVRTAGPVFGTPITVNAGYNLRFNITSIFGRTADFTVGPRSDNTISTTAGTGSTTSAIVLASGASSVDSFYVGGVLQVALPAAFTASISTTTMTVSAISSGRLVVGSLILGGGLNAQQVITAQTGGTPGGIGTYTLATSNTLASRAMTGLFAEGRTITAYVGSTRTATVGAQQGSSATLTYAPVNGDIIRVGSLVEPSLYVNGYGDETDFNYSFGLNAAKIVTDPILASGDPTGVGIVSRDLNFIGTLTFSNSLSPGTIFARNTGACTWDGVADVSPCIQAAITAAVAAGGAEVALPAGTLPIKTSLTATGPFMLRGTGVGTILKPTSDNVNASSVLLMALGSGITATISDLVFDGGSESGTQTNPLTQLFHTTNVVFRNVTWRNAAGIGLNGSGANGTQIINPVVSKVGNRWKTTLSASDRHAGLSFCCGDGTTIGFDTVITGGHFSDIGLDAINLGTTTRTVIANNVFYLENNQRALMTLTNYPAAVYGVNEKYLTISGNTINQAQGNGIDLPGVQFASISGNAITLSGQAGIGLFLGVDLSTQVTDVAIVGNAISNNKQWTASPWTGAISIGGPSGGPQGSPDRVTIAANNLVDTQGSPTQPYGVQITAGATPTNLLISTSNNVTGNATAQFLNANWAAQNLTAGTTAVTQAVDDATTAVATDAFVLGQAASATPLVDGTGAPGTSTRFARGDHVHPTDTSRAPLASPTLTGTVTIPTAAAGTSSTVAASTAFVANAIIPGNAAIFGTGADGALTCSSGTTTLTHDGHYTTITPSGTCKINTAGYNLYASVLLDISNAGAQAIYNAAAAGNNATGATGASGVGSSQPATTTSLAIAAGTAAGGATGTTGAGAAGSASAGLNGAGGNGLAGAAGGTSGANAGGAGGAAGGLSLAGNAVLRIAPVGMSFVANGGRIVAGQNGAGGGSGGGDGSNAGGGGGGAGQGGLHVYIAAAVLARGSNSTAGIIQAIGGAGGNGGNGAGGNAAGGGGGSAGAGGFVQLIVGGITGSTITNAIDVSGGKAGNGGNAVGTGGGGLIVAGGNGGGVMIGVLNPASFTNTLVGNSVTGSAGTAPSGITGGTGGVGAVARANL